MDSAVVQEQITEKFLRRVEESKHRPNRRADAVEMEPFNAVAKLLCGHAGRPPSFSKFMVPVHDRQSICFKRLRARVLLVESLTLGDQDVERLLNCLDGQPRLSTNAMPSFPLTHAEPPASTRPVP